MTGQPASVTAWCDGFEADCGVRPRAELVDVGRWRFTVDTGRVVMVVEYKLLPRDRFQQRSSRLVVDGERQPLAESYEQLRRLLLNPDGPIPDQVPGDGDLVEVTGDQVPKDVRGLARVAVLKLPKALSVRVLQGPDRWWVVQAANARVDLRLNLRSTLMDPKRPTWDRRVAEHRDQPVSVWVDGVDRTAEVSGMIDSAMAMVANVLAAPAPPPVSATSGVQVTATGVTVRQQKVLRL